MDIDEFLKSQRNQPRGRKLHVHRAVIRELREKGATYEQIRLYLEMEYSVRVTWHAIRKHYLKQLERQGLAELAGEDRQIGAHPTSAPRVATAEGLSTEMPNYRVKKSVEREPHETDAASAIGMRPRVERSRDDPRTGGLFAIAETSATDFVGTAPRPAHPADEQSRRSATKDTDIGRTFDQSQVPLPAYDRAVAPPYANEASPTHTPFTANDRSRARAEALERSIRDGTFEDRRPTYFRKDDDNDNST
jgi:hypothetical protein